MAGWIGVDLDGTLAHFDRWRGPRHIGLPIPAMAKRVHDWHARGVEVRIFTARASRPELIPDVQDWLSRHGFPPFAVTNQKDFGMVELWDDRAIQVLYNTGKAVRPNRLEETEKAELFDPDEDVVFADDNENKEVEPTADEVEEFKRNIKASSDTSLHSLDDLLDALDDGEYSPGDTPDDIKVDTDKSKLPKNSHVAKATATSLDVPKSELPSDTFGFVTSDIELDKNTQPRNAIVEINLDAEDLNLEEAGDATDRFKPAVAEEADVNFAEIADSDLAKISSQDTELGDSDTSPAIENNLENQPVDDAPLIHTNDDEPNFDSAIDDIPEDPKEPVISLDGLTKQTPFFSAFPDDELDDLHDLPPLKVERR